MILYVAENLGVANTGEAFAARSELLALLATGRSVTVLTRRQAPLPTQVDAIPIPAPRWITSEHICLPYPPELNRAYLKAQWKLCQMTRAVRILRPDLFERAKTPVTWVNTTPVDDERHARLMKKFARFERDVVAYNEAAEAVMRRRGVPVIDLHGFTKRLGPDIFDDHVHFTPEVRKKQARCLADGLPVCPRT